MQGEINGEKFKGVAVDVGTTLMEGIGSLLGTLKVRKQSREIEQLQSMLGESKNENVRLKHEVDKITSVAQVHINKIVDNAQNEINEMKRVHEQKELKLEQEKQWYKQQLSTVFDWIPIARELLRIEQLCKSVGLPKEHISTLFA